MDMSVVRIKDLGKIVTGNTPPRNAPEFYGDFIPFIKATDIEIDSKYTFFPEEYYSKIAFEKYKKSLVPKGSTCVVTIGTVGKKMTMAHTDMFINQAMNAIVPSSQYDAEYVYYLMKYNLFQLKGIDSGTTSGRENISKSAFSNIQVSVIDNIAHQRSIGTILSAYDNLIEVNNKRIKVLEQMAENLYKEWFVRFRFPGHETAEFENGIPKGWEYRRIGDLAPVKSGYAFKSDWWTEEGIPAVKIKDIASNTIDMTDFSRVEQKYADKAKQFYVSAGDLLIALTGATIGKIAIVPYAEKMTVNQRVGKFFLGSDPWKSVAFHFCFFLQERVQEEIASIAGSNAAQPNISPTDIENLKTYYNFDIVKSFNEFLSPIILYMLKLRKLNETLIKQRDLLLPRLMSGKLEV